MTIPLANTILGLILMHGISMTMWRALLNNTIPSLSSRSSTRGGILPRFNLQLTNTLPPSDLPTTPIPTIQPPTFTTTSQSQPAPMSMLTSPSMIQPVLQPIIQVHQVPIPLSQPPPQMVIVQPPLSPIRDSFQSSSYLMNNQPQRLMLQAVQQQYQPQQQQTQFMPMQPQASTLNPIVVKPDSSTIESGLEFRSPLDELLKNHDMSGGDNISIQAEKNDDSSTSKKSDLAILEENATLTISQPDKTELS